METVSRSDSLRFFAMEYYLLMWNRTFEVTATSSALSGAFVRGVVSASSPSVIAARRSGDAADLGDDKRLARARSHPAGSPDYLALHRCNFSTPRSSIASVRFDPRRKWGMGPVPQSGRLHVEVRGGKRRELILLGDQDGPALARQLNDLGYPGPAV